MPIIYDPDDTPQQITPGAHGKPKPKRKKKLTKRQLEQRVLAERGRVYEMREHALRMLHNSRQILISALEDPNWESRNDYNTRWCKWIMQEHPFLVDRDPTMQDVAGSENRIVAWAEASYRKAVIEYEKDHGHLPNHLKLEDPHE